VDGVDIRTSRARFAAPPSAAETDATTLIPFRNGRVSLTALGNGKRRLSLETLRDGEHVRRASWTTAYSDELVRLILNAKGPALCDEIMRDEDPSYIRRHLDLTVTAHIDPKELAGQEVLDFGCGAGASTVILSEVLPESRITGIELRQANLDVARARAEFYGLKHTRFLLSPSGGQLPDGIGPFGGIMLSAVFEHLLPAERATLLPSLWRVLAPGGVLFIDETPSRWFPIETHTTGLPFINYLPDRLAAAYARRFSRRVRRDATWDEMRRDGIRGATVNEILGVLPAGEGRPVLLAPRRLGIKGSLDLWLRGYAEGGSRGWRGAVKRGAAAPLKIAARVLDGASLVPYLSLAIRKSAL
jgi:2-polyprenyl-3-methyl-5-hydroxy-6-metoxy-1,4-benzoquinol methylase